MGSVAGCTDILADGTDETRLTFLLFHNVADEEQRVAVRVKDGTTVYEEIVTIEPHSTDLLPPDSVRPEGYPTDSGRYEVVFQLQARADEQGRADFDLGTVDAECVGYTVWIRADGNEGEPRMEVFPNTGCDQGRGDNESN